MKRLALWFLGVISWVCYAAAQRDGTIPVPVKWLMDNTDKMTGGRIATQIRRCLQQPWHRQKEIRRFNERHQRLHIESPSLGVHVIRESVMKDHKPKHREGNVTVALRRAAFFIALGVQLGSLGCGAGPPSDRETNQQAQMIDNSRTETQTAERAAAETAANDAREAKSQEDSAKRLRRRCMSKNDIDTFLWVERHLFEEMIKKGSDVTLAKARTEVATARAFDFEPANWAKRDIGAFLETDRIWKEKRDEVENRLEAAQRHSSEVESEMIRTQGNEFDPLKNASIYWFKNARSREPNNPYAIAIEAERKIEREREQLYHRFKKETPEERLGGGLAILFWMGISGGAGRGALAGETEAALTSLGRAEAALTAAESDAALTSIMRARAILSAAEEAEALAAVGRARTALVAGETDAAAVAVDEAQAALAAKLQANPAAALALAAINKAEAKLDAAERADTDLGVNEKVKIDLFDYASAHQDDVMEFLAADLGGAIRYAARYRESVANGEIIPTKDGDKVMRKGC